MKSFAIIVNIGGRSKRINKSVAKVAYSNSKVYGLTEYYGPKGSNTTDGCKVFIYSRQSRRELADTFFHEMTHIFLHMIGKVKKQGRNEEFLARWIGYLAKMNLADYSKDYARDFKITRRIE
jgi:hypothetical protein